MADLKISELGSGAPAAGGDQIAVNRSGTNYRLTLSEVQTLILGTLTTDVANNASAITALQNDRVLRAGDTMTGDLTMGTNEVHMTNAPTTGTALANKTYVDGFLHKSGGTMTGDIVLAGDPTLALHPVTLQYLQATYIQSTGTNNYLARFNPNGKSLVNSLVRDDGSTTSINGTLDSTIMLKVDTTLAEGVTITNSGTSGNKIALKAVTNGANSAINYGGLFQGSNTGNGDIYGVSSSATNSGTSTSDLIAVGYNISAAGSTTSAAAYGLKSDVFSVGTGKTVTNTYSHYMLGHSGAGTITNAYHLYMAAHSTGTNKWAIYQAGANDQNYLNGDTTIGTTVVDSAKLTVNGSASRGVSVTTSGSVGIYTHVVSGSADLIGHEISILGAAGITSAKGVDIAVTPSLGATNSYSIYGNGHASAIGVTNGYHIYLEAHGGGVTNTYGIYQAGTSDINYFAGKTAFGQTNSVSSLGSNYGIQINGDNSNAAMLYIDSQSSTRNATISLNVDSGGGVGQANSAMFFSIDNSAKYVIGLNQEAGTVGSGATGSPRGANSEFVIARAGDFDPQDNRLFVARDTGGYRSFEMALGTDPRAGVLLTLGTDTKELGFVAADTTGTPTTQAGYIQVDIEGTTKYIQLFTNP